MASFVYKTDLVEEGGMGGPVVARNLSRNLPGITLWWGLRVAIHGHLPVVGGERECVVASGGLQRDGPAVRRDQVAAEQIHRTTRIGTVTRHRRTSGCCRVVLGRSQCPVLTVCWFPPAGRPHVVGS